MIDPHAVIHPDARLAEGVSVGAFSVIGADVEIGADTWIGSHVVIKGHTRIGRDNKLFQFSSIGEDPQFIGYKGETTWLEIGDRNTIREYCTLNRGSHIGNGVTKIGDDNFIMAYVHIAHDCIVGNNAVFANNASLAGHVTIGDYAILGGFTLVHQFCRIGAHSISGINSICLKDIPPYLLCAGNPTEPHGVNIKGLRRRDFSDATITNLKRAYRTLYRSKLDLQSALKQLDKLAQTCTEVGHLAAFIRSTERGIIR